MPIWTLPLKVPSDLRESVNPPALKCAGLFVSEKTVVHPGQRKIGK